MSIKFKTLSQLKELLEKKELSSYELVSETLEIYHQVKRIPLSH